MSKNNEVFHTVVIQPVLTGKTDENKLSKSSLVETVGLAKAIGLKVLTDRIINIRNPSPASLFGSGTINDFKRIISNLSPDLIIIGMTLSPIQQRNLEREWQVKVIDRTALIIEIFGDRARTREGVLQVDLAALSYQRSRLVRSWTHLERQRGGAGFLGGPGESQLEIDRRLIDKRISKLKQQLEQVKRTRGLHRKARNKIPLPIVSLVGYTNAGKSTLFNLLTQSDVIAEDMLFATLDPTMRALKLPSGQKVILSDTVGFIQELPTHLIAAFRSTLEEVIAADLVLHIRDAAHPESDRQRDNVNLILTELFNGKELSSENVPPIVEVYNKIDLLDDEQREYIRNQTGRYPGFIALSSLSGEGCPGLIEKIYQIINVNHNVIDVDIPITDGATLAWLYENGNIIERRDKRMSSHLKVQLSPKNETLFMRRKITHSK
ncbi:MAG: GTPase HflX [Alphaproteobacteria bacterium]